MRFAQQLLMLTRPRLWVAMLLLVAQVLQVGPCCCWRGSSSARGAADCCCTTAVPDADLQVSSAFGVDNKACVSDEVCETPPSGKCGCPKTLFVGVSLEAFSTSTDSSKSFHSHDVAFTSATFDRADSGTFKHEGRRRSVVGLAGVECCAHLCRWLC